MKTETTYPEITAAATALQLLASSFPNQLAQIENKSTTSKSDTPTMSQNTPTLPFPNIHDINAYFIVCFTDPHIINASDFPSKEEFKLYIDKGGDLEEIREPMSSRDIEPDRMEELELVYSERLNQKLKFPGAQKKDFLEEETEKIENWIKQIHAHDEQVQDRYPSFKYKYTLKRYWELLRQKQQELLNDQQPGKKNKLEDFIKTDAIPWLEKAEQKIHADIDKWRNEELSKRGQIECAGFCEALFDKKWFKGLDPAKDNVNNPTVRYFAAFRYNGIDISNSVRSGNKKKDLGRLYYKNRYENILKKM